MILQATELSIGRRKVRVSNPGKVMYPANGFTKGDVVEYYRAIAPPLVRHLRGRPITLKRYPNGADKPFFFEKNCPSHKPDWVPTADVHGSTGTVNHCLIEDAASIVWVANLAALELHTLLSKSDQLDRPTMVVFDLDPGAPADILDCIPIAFRMREIFDHFGLESFVKTSGGKGLHIYVPLNTPTTFPKTKEFAHAIARLLEKEMPDRVLSNMSKQLRGGKIFVDWSQNDSHKTTVSAYSLRASELPTISTPVTWDEVAKAQKLRSAEALQFQASDVLKRVEKLGDLFLPVLKLKQKLPATSE